jgi:hypothetical protein
METAYVLNLKHRTDRWEKIQNDFINAPFKLERVDGVMMTNPFQQPIQDQFEAVGRTHYELLKRAKRRGEKTILVLEDDCQPEKEYVANWTKMKDWLDSHLDEWDVFNGGPLGFTNITNHLLLDECVLFSTDKTGCASHWVYFNVEKMIPKLADWNRRACAGVGIDIDGYYFLHCNTLSAFPTLGIQAEGWSDIAQMNRDHWAGRFFAAKLAILKYLQGVGITICVDL